jgi:hypothetical protein
MQSSTPQLRDTDWPQRTAVAADFLRREKEEMDLTKDTVQHIDLCERPALLRPTHLNQVLRMAIPVLAALIQTPGILSPLGCNIPFPS